MPKKRRAAVMVISEKQLALTIVATLMNRFDFYAIVDGFRGLGKSTLAFRLSKLVTKYFRAMYRGNIDIIIKVYKLIKKERKDYTLEEMVKYLRKLKSKRAYIFNPMEDLIYDQRSALVATDSWQRIAIFDEFINIGFTRDFFDKGQKDLIKLLNLNRDHNNLTFACIPHFLSADVQLRNLCKMRIYIHKRGEAIIMTPNRGTSVRDKWDTDINFKIEAEWRKKGHKNPAWGRLTTFRARMKTYPLAEKDEELYQEIKNLKRANLILKSEEQQDPRTKAYKELLEDLKSFEIKSIDELKGAAKAIGITYDTLRANLKKMLREEGLSTDFKDYLFSQKKASREVQIKKAEKMLENMEPEEIILRRIKEGRHNKVPEFWGGKQS